MKSKYVHVYNKYHKFFYLYNHFYDKFYSRYFFAAGFRVKFASFLYEQAFQNRGLACFYLIKLILNIQTYRRQPTVSSLVREALSTMGFRRLHLVCLEHVYPLHWTLEHFWFVQILKRLNVFYFYEGKRNPDFITCQ